MHRPLVACIDTSALQHNLAVVRRHAGTARIMAVVKANAYGHGLLRAAAALQAADGFAVLNIEEGIELREAGHRQPVLMLEGFFSTQELLLASQHRIDVVVHCKEQLAMLDAVQLAQPLTVYLKMNTGMNRLGFRPAAFQAALARLAQHANVAVVATMTHYASGDAAHGVDAPLALFQTIPAPGHATSLANSAAILLQSADAHGDWVRAGIALYGAAPDETEHVGADYGLRPVMTLKSRIIAVQEVAAGEAVGYGGAYVARQSQRIGIVACGYADGYPRHAFTGTPVCIDGQPGQTLGRVSMDMLFVDLSGHPAVNVGSEVILWGNGLPVEKVARAAGTISYELLSALMPRVPVMDV